MKLILTTHTKGVGGISEIYLDHAKKDLKRAGVRVTQVVGLFFLFFLKSSKQTSFNEPIHVTKLEYHQLLVFTSSLT